MAAPRLPFLYPNLMRAIRSCEPSTYRSIRIPAKNGSFHTTRRYAQEAYRRRYGPAAAEVNLPPPSPPAGNIPNTTPAEQAHTQDPTKSNTSEESFQAGDEKAAEASDSKSSDEPDLHEELEPNADDTQTSESATEHAGEERSAPHLLHENPLEDVIHMPSPSSYLTTTDVSAFTGKPPHMTPTPYIHHFDTYSLVCDLSKAGFTDDQSITIMKAVRNILQSNLDLAKQSLTSKSDVENETYLFKAACSELQSSLQTTRNTEMQRQRASRTQLQHEADILSQRLNQELAGLKDDIKGMFNDHKMNMREQQRSIDTSVQELNYKITVSLNSDGKSEIEGLRWILTRRAAMAIAISAFMIILFLKYHSVRKALDTAEKKKEPPAKEVTEKRVVQDHGPPPMPEVILNESLG